MQNPVVRVGEIARPLVCTAGHVGVEPFSGELARLEQLAMSLFPFPGSDALLVRLATIRRDLG